MTLTDDIAKFQRLNREEQAREARRLAEARDRKARQVTMLAKLASEIRGLGLCASDGAPITVTQREDSLDITIGPEGLEISPDRYSTQFTIYEVDSRVAPMVRKTGIVTWDELDATMARWLASRVREVAC